MLRLVPTKIEIRTKCAARSFLLLLRGGFRGGGGGGGGGGPGGSDPPLSYMKDDIMHTVIYAAFCMLPSLDLQNCTSF